MKRSTGKETLAPYIVPDVPQTVGKLLSSGVGDVHHDDLPVAESANLFKWCDEEGAMNEKKTHREVKMAKHG